MVQFAAVTRGPRNYVFRQQQLPSPAMLTNSQSTSENDELPLITVRLDTKSGIIILACFSLYIATDAYGQGALY